MRDNLDFLSEVFGDCWKNAHVVAIPGNPYEAEGRDWHGGRAGDLIESLLGNVNNYFTISTFVGGRRTKGDFEATYAIVLDDIGEGGSAKVSRRRVDDCGLPEPSYRLLTSPGNEQWGYLLEPECRERYKVERFQRALIKMGIADAEGKDAGMMGVTRYVRLPDAINGKPAYENGSGPFQCEMLDWSPDERWSIEELAGLAGIDLGVEPEAEAAAIDPMKDDPFVQWAKRTGLHNGERGDQHLITCFDVHEHTEALDNGSYYRSPGLFYCHHGTHEDRSAKQWWALMRQTCGEDVASELSAYIDGKRPLKPFAPLRALVGGIPYGPPFPVELLPECMQPFVAALAESTQTPVGMGGALALAAIATAVQGRVAVAVKEDYLEPVNLFVAAVAPPASRKSAVFAAVQSPIWAEEARQAKAAAPRVERNRQALELHEMRVKGLKKKTADGDTAAADMLEDLIDKGIELKEAQLTEPSLVVSDITSEELAVQMSEQAGVMALWNPEGGGMFDIAGGRYNQGEGNFDIFLKGHAGDSVKVHRRIAEPIKMAEAILTVAVAMQPGVLSKYAEHRGFRDRGLLGRFCWVIPESRIGERDVRAQPVEERLKAEYRDLIEGLFMLNSGSSRVSIRLTPEAFDVWADFFDETERTLHPVVGRLAKMAMTDWGGKLPGLAARIAGLLHCVEMVGRSAELWRAQISKETMTRAIGLATFFRDHAVETYRFMAGAAQSDGVTKVWNAVCAESRAIGGQTVAEQDVWQRVKPGGRNKNEFDMEDCKQALEEIERKGHIRGSWSGRKKVWEINPKVHISDVK